MDIFKHAIEPCKKTEQCRKNKDWHQETFDRCFQKALVMAEVQNKQGLAAQSKAEAIGWNKISSANQRPGFQMIFYTCQSARHMIMQLWFAV